MQSLKDKLVQAGVIPEDYRPGETAEQRSARLPGHGRSRRFQGEPSPAGGRD